MIYYNPPHEVRDEDKLQSMIDTLESGGSLPPIVVQGYTAFTGSHRIAAWDYCNVEAEIVEVSDEDYVNAMIEAGWDQYDDIYDYNDFCKALYNVTRDSEVKSAIADQF